MDILVISHKYPPSIGGMQTHCYKLVQSLRKNHVVHELIWKSNYSKIWFFLTTVIRALRILRKNKSIDIIYVNDGLMALIATPLLFLTKVPMVVTIHGLDINFPSSLYQWWVKKYLNQFDQIITVSGPTTALCLKKGLDPGRVTKVENAVDIDFGEPLTRPNFKEAFSKEIGIDLTEKFVLVSLGRAIPRKGFNWFTREVMPLLSDQIVYLVIARKFPEARLFERLKFWLPHALYEKIRLLVGAEIDDVAVNESIKELGFEKRVFHLHQFTHSREKIFEIIANSDLFVMPNIAIKGDYEGFGLVALEAASQGTLTLAANVDGIPSAVVDGQNGYLLAPGEPNIWAEKINYLMTHSEELEAKATQFQQDAIQKNRSWDAMAQKYVEVFQNISAHK